MSRQIEWRQYQDDVAALLLEFGFDVKVDERLKGARGDHDVDVTARMRVAGVDQLWIVECKAWKHPIPKERALTFLGVVADVGADRGLMFSESGFQSGAVRATSNTNVTLTSLEDFKQNSAIELAAMRIKALDARIARLSQQYHALWDDRTEEGRAAVMARYVGPSSIAGHGFATAITGRLSMMQRVLEEVRYGRWPVPFLPLDDDVPILVNDWEGLKFLMEETLATCTRIYEHMIDSESHVSGWKELQSPRLTELLDRIRGT